MNAVRADRASAAVGYAGGLHPGRRHSGQADPSAPGGTRRCRVEWNFTGAVRSTLHRIWRREAIGFARELPLVSIGRRFVHEGLWRRRHGRGTRDCG